MEERYRLTPWGCFNVACMDFDIEPPKISGPMAKALMDDFFEIMKVQGILVESEDDEVI